MRIVGTVKWFNDSKGYGFIKKSDGSEVFVHHTGINMHGRRTLVEDQRVEFLEVRRDKGLQAVEVTVIG